MKEQKERNMPKKSKAEAIASFVFGLTFWIPLLNLIFGLIAIYAGIDSLVKIRKEPIKYGGKWFAVAGIALGFIVYITYFTGLSMCLYGYKDICKNMGL